LARSLSLSTCTPTQAQQLLLATGLALQRRPGSAAVERILGVRVRDRSRRLIVAANSDKEISSSLMSLISKTRRKHKRRRHREAERQRGVMVC
jgi:hypothetical protein